MAADGSPLSKAGAWSSGLCDCFGDMETCCCTWCCSILMVGQNAELSTDGQTGCATAALVYGGLQILGGAGRLYSFTMRTRLRQKFGLPEEPCNDFVVHCCCQLCAICQETRELKRRGWDVSLPYSTNMQLLRFEEEAAASRMGPPAQQTMVDE